jgi:hypothetical protein
VGFSYHDELLARAPDGLSDLEARDVFDALDLDARDFDLDLFAR